MTSPQALDPQVVATMQAAMLQARRGDFAGARATAEQALSLGVNTGPVHAMLGMFCCQSGDLPAGISHLREALRIAPTDIAAAANLATALLETGQPDEALALCTVAAAQADPSARLWRLRGYLLQVTQDFAGATEAYRQAVGLMPDDFESWNNLGNACAATGDADGSIAALKRAAALRPDIAPIRLNLAATLSETGHFDEAIETLQACTRDFPRDAKPLVELAALFKQLYRDPEALEMLEQAAKLDPTDADLQVKLGTERALAWAMEDAEEAFHNALAREPAHPGAYTLLGVLLEQTNRIAEFPNLIASAEAAGVEEGTLQFLRVLSYRRERRFEEGLAALASIPADIEPIRCAHLAGQFHERLGNAGAAFAAFAEMNRQLALDPSDPLSRAAEYRTAIDRERTIVTPQWYRDWRPVGSVPTGRRRAPAFLVGFPRSGTTLLDTMLMGHPDVRVLEEQPPLNVVAQALGDIDRLVDLGEADIEALRETYFREAAKYVDLPDDALLVDKFPLHLIKVPLIHRLFPDARFILALRHPCDVVLSCFITNFRLNNAMANFIDLETSAHLYDQTFGYWAQCRAIMPIEVREVVYERLVADSEAELRPLFDYLGLDWRGEVLDHRQTAAERGLISTASYAQVIEPIYNRAAGRWTRYREQIAPIIPVLRPWVEQFGYAL